jgi:hypothetical protein
MKSDVEMYSKHNYILSIKYCLKSAVTIIAPPRYFDAVSNKFNLLNLYVSSKFITKIELKSNNSCWPVRLGVSVEGKEASEFVRNL